MWRPSNITLFMPRATLQILLRFLPKDLAHIVVAAARDQVLPPWDVHGFWAVAPPEYDQNGEYASLPKVETSNWTPMW